MLGAIYFATPYFCASKSRYCHVVFAVCIVTDMDTLITVAVLLALGIVGLALLRVAKNVAYVIFIMLVGYILWLFLSPLIGMEGKSISDASKNMNEAYQEAAMKNMDENTKAMGDRMAEKVVGDIENYESGNNSNDVVRAQQKIEAKVEAAPLPEAEEVESWFATIVRILKEIVSFK